MPTFTNKVYEIRLRQEQQGQEVVNMFYYMDDETGPAVGLNAVGSAFDTAVLRKIEAIQHEDVSGVDIRTRVLGGGVEDVIDITAQTGTRIGGITPSFNAWGFKLNRTNIDIRNGSKRFCGITEEDTFGNEPNPSILSALADVATELAATLVLANLAELTPVIFRIGSFTNPEWFGSIIASALFSRITSQVSRKASAS